MQRGVWTAVTCLVLAGCAATDAAPIEPPVSLTCGGTPVPRGSRLLGMDFLDTPEVGGFDVNTVKAREAGAQFISLPVAWSAIEATPSQFSDPGNVLQTIRGYLATTGFKLSLTLRPIDVTGKTVPSDLSRRRFNDPQVAARFTAMLDWVFTQVDYRTLTSLQVGNEIDGYDTISEHPDFWSDYGAFLFAVNTHVKQRYPGLRIGFTATLPGLTSGPLADAGVFTALLGAVDVLGVTYYPLNPDFTMRPVSSVQTDLATLVQRYPTATIFIQEAGYASAAANASDDLQQAAFFCELFKAWDTHSARIGLVSLLRLHDLSRAKAVQAAGPYGLSSEQFIEYLRSLGVRTFGGGGQDKAAYFMIVNEATKRGWR